MNNIILKVENVSKQYRLGTVSTGTLKHDLNRFWHKIRGKQDPYLKIGSVNDRSVQSNDQYVWALQDIDFEIAKGEVLGIIGKNGAGKSTLLKILSKVTGPTMGVIKANGRIASLLEVGTGFHPELTGRENIYLNGTILGMTKAEIARKEAEIVEFSGCAKYIDTPVKRYSSGMRVRLAFAVAAHLEPDILVVDEVLAVGDAEFQKKAIGKMQDISNTDGRTVLFVSHNMESIQQLCTRAILLENGKISFDGPVSETISKYLEINSFKQNITLPLAINYGTFTHFHIKDNSGNLTDKLLMGKSCSFGFGLLNKSDTSQKVIVRLQFFDSKGVLYSTLNSFVKNKVYNLESNKELSIDCYIDKLCLVDGVYTLGIQLLNPELKTVFYENEAFWKLEVLRSDFYNSGKIPNKNNIGKFLMDHTWELTEK